jgi:hypothetical protein
MSRKLVGLLISFAVLSLAFVFLSEPAKSRSKLEGARTGQEVERQLDVMQQQVEGLQQLVDQMKRERSQLAAKPAGAAAAEPVEHAAETEASDESAAQRQGARSRDELDPVVALQQERAYFSTYFSELDARRGAETPDERFGAAVRDHVGSMMEEMADLAHSTIDTIDCGATLCRIEASHADDHAKGQFMLLFSHHAAPLLNDGTTQADPDTLKTTGYFAREGFERPEPSEGAMAAFAQPEGP